MLTGLLRTRCCRLQAVLQKQGRKSQFRSVAERDRWLQEHIAQLKAARQQQSTRLQAEQAALEQLTKDANDRATVKAVQAACVRPVSVCVCKYDCCVLCAPLAGVITGMHRLQAVVVNDQLTLLNLLPCLAARGRC